MPPLFRGLATEFPGRRHAVMKRDRIEVEAVGPSQRAKLDENARKERRVLQRQHHLSVARDRRGKIMHAGRAVGKRNPQSDPPMGFTEITSIIGSCDPEAAAVRLRMMPILIRSACLSFTQSLTNFACFLGKRAADDLTAADAYKCLCTRIDCMHMWGS
jgi:hypothetical protein